MRVLIADDEAVIRMGLRTMLEDKGHRVVATATDGASAVEMARTEKPEVILLDIKMPGMDGIAAARKIMQERPTPIVMLTAYSQRELVNEAREASVFGYLVKPVKEDLLDATLELAVTRFKEWQKLQRQIHDLNKSLAAREMVEDAKRVLMQKEHLSEQQAFNKIHRASRSRRVTMQQVAQEILNKADQDKKNTK
ncbi:MAG: response regulator [Chloroflexota bacterium]|nr:MAG: response regulator [Chloroflexota bacterium]